MSQPPTETPAPHEFFVTGGTLRGDAPCYVERLADPALVTGLSEGQFCYVLTARQMGKSSLMVRAADRLRAAGATVLVLDLTAIGLNLTPEQWYDGLMVRVGQQTRLEDALDHFWCAHQRLSPVQRWFAALREVVLPHLPPPPAANPASADSADLRGRLIVFIDEIDTVRSLPFATDEFFAAIRECYNRRVQDPAFNRLTFCLLGVALPNDLIQDTRTTPFMLGRCIELPDFTPAEAGHLTRGLARGGIDSPPEAQRLLQRILYWTNGHPYLTQRLCHAVLQSGAARRDPDGVDRLCQELFLSARARERDDNLLFVREWLLHAGAQLMEILDLYGGVRQSHPVRDDEASLPVRYLRLSGIVRSHHGFLAVRNRIYEQVFDPAWIQAHRPAAVLLKPGGESLPLPAICALGRVSSNEVVLPDGTVSRRHALIRQQEQDRFWLVDLNSSNGTFLNGQRVFRPVMLTDQDRIQIGPFELVFRQKPRPGRASREHNPPTDHTIISDSRE